MNFRGCLIADALPHNKREKTQRVSSAPPTGFNPPRQRLERLCPVFLESSGNSGIQSHKKELAQATQWESCAAPQLHRHDIGGIALHKHERLPVKPQTYRAGEHDAARDVRPEPEPWSRSPASLQTHCCQQKGARSLLQMCIKNACCSSVLCVTRLGTRVSQHLKGRSN